MTNIQKNGWPAFYAALRVADKRHERKFNETKNIADADKIAIKFLEGWKSKNSKTLSVNPNYLDFINGTIEGYKS